MRMWKRMCLVMGVLATFACSKTYESSIPSYEVYLELDLTYQDKALKAIQAYKIYDRSNIDQEGERTGFGGVLVYHGLGSDGGDAYYAFDAACPHEASRNTRVEVDEDGLYAVCPACNSRFELINGFGNPVSGPAEYNLKAYQVFHEGNKIYVRN